MKLMSFNTQHCLNYLEQKIDFQIMADAILTCEADIVGLNEMRDAGVHHEFVNQTGILAEKTGLENYYFAKAIDESKTDKNVWAGRTDQGKIIHFPKTEDNLVVGQHLFVEVERAEAYTIYGKIINERG